MAWVLGGTPPTMEAALIKRIKNAKAPADLIPITIDFRGALAALDFDSLNLTTPVNIVSVRHDDVPSDLIFVPPVQFNSDATRITCWFAAGTVVTEYLISITAQSVLGQTLERSFILPVYYR